MTPHKILKFLGKNNNKQVSRCSVKKHKIEIKVHLVCTTLDKYKQKARALESKKEYTRKLVVVNIYKQLHCNVDSKVLNSAL